MSKTVILDSNAILRHILKDDLKQFNIVEAVIEKEDVLVLPEVVEEVVYILTKYYKMPANIIASNLLLFLEDISCANDLLIKSIKSFAKRKLDFVDCLLVEYFNTGRYNILSFDKKLNKLLS
jgi:predicted nucleic-acid-binding protein